jgi:hypothetical protein
LAGAEAAPANAGLLGRLARSREALVVIAFSGANALLGLFANRVLTQLVPPRPLGELYLFLNLGLWLTLPSSAAFLYVQRHWAVARERQVVRAFGRGLFLGLASQLLLVLLGVAAVAATGLLPLSPRAALWLCIAAAAQATLQTLTQLQGLERRRVLAGLLDLLNQPARLLVLALGARLLLGGAPDGEGLLGLQAGFSGLLALLVALLGTQLLQKLAPLGDRGTPGPQLGLWPALRFSLPFLLSSVVAQLCASAERWGLARLEDPGATALFVQAVGLAAAVCSAATGFLGNYFYPLIHQAAAQGARPLQAARIPLLHFLCAVFSICCLLVLGASAGAGRLTGLLFGPRYLAVAHLLPWTVAGAALFTCGQAVSVVSLVARDAVGPNAARTVPLVLYAAALLTLRPAAEAALAFSQLYCASQALYLCLMIGSVLWVARREAGGER